MRHRRRKNLLKMLILGFAASAIVAAGAQASYHTTEAQNARSALNQTYSPEALRALTLRSEAMNEQYQSLATRPDDRSGVRGIESQSVTPDLSEVQRHVKADAYVSQSTRPDDRAGSRGPGTVSTRPDDRAGFRGPGTVRTPEVVAVKGDGFDWKDAGIGAGAMIGIVLVLGSGLALSRRRSELAV
jgi:hypothetical protein